MRTTTTATAPTTTEATTAGGWCRGPPLGTPGARIPAKPRAGRDAVGPTKDEVHRRTDDCGERCQRADPAGSPDGLRPVVRGEGAGRAAPAAGRGGRGNSRDEAHPPGPGRLP